MKTTKKVLTVVDIIKENKLYKIIFNDGSFEYRKTLNIK